MHSDYAYLCKEDHGWIKEIKELNIHVNACVFMFEFTADSSHHRRVRTTFTPPSGRGAGESVSAESLPKYPHQRAAGLPLQTA